MRARDETRVILVVDDDDDVRDAFVDALRFEGFAVESARDGEQALRWLCGHLATPCVVLLDLMMPVMSGQTFLDLKAKDLRLAAVPVILLTAGGDVRALKESGTLAHYLPKTVPLRDLIVAIESCG